MSLKVAMSLEAKWHPGFRSRLTFSWCAAALSWMLLGMPLPLQAQETPTNVILFIGDDIGWNDIGCYGNEHARTPTIDRLARHGLRFENAFLTASSCSPSRCSIISSRYPHNLGTAAELHGALPWHIPLFPALLRDQGYYTALSGKNHMARQPSPADQPKLPDPFDHVGGGNMAGNSGGHARWVEVLAERPRDRPFFFWFAAIDAHRAWDGDREWDAEKYGPMHDPAAVVVPPFLLDNEQTRRDLASYYNEVTRFDYFIGQVVEELERQEVLDNTLILVMADNGRPFPRAKTRLHDSGMKTFFVAHYPDGISVPGETVQGMVSAIDIAPTILELAGVESPETFQGMSFAELFEDPTSEFRNYCFSEHNWHDYEAYGRSVRTKEHLYILNGRPALPWQGPADSVRSPSHQTLRASREEGVLNEAQLDVFLAPRPEEELYNRGSDLHQLENLTESESSAQALQQLRLLMKQWQEVTGDTVPEHISSDQFDRETGRKVIDRRDQVLGTIPGEEVGAVHVNARLHPTR